MHVVKTFLVLVISSLLTISAMGQTVTAKMGAEMIGSWLVEVEGSNRDRALIVVNVSEKSQDSLSLEGKFGWSGTEQPLSVAEINTVTKELKLVAKSGAKITATQTANGSFVGKFFDRNDQAKEVKITKAAENELQTRRTDSSPALEKPAAEVPATCAAFAGAWTGTWANSGVVWLWVVSVDTNCVAKYAYSKNPKPKNFLTGQIKKGVLEIPTSAGINYFEFRGNNLFDRFIGSGIDDTLAFTRVDVSEGSLSRLISNQRITEGAGAKATPPSSEVPLACANFYGSWIGTWGYGIPEQLLRIVEVDAKCVAKYSYANSKIVSSVFKTSEIKDGVLSFMCNSETGGTCTFKAGGGTIDGIYFNPSGGRNSATFKKAQ